MLNYWRTTATTGEGGAATFFTGNSSLPTANNPLIPAATPFSDYGTDDPFFDLEFALSDHIHEASESSPTETDDEMTQIELNFDVHDQNFQISPFNKLHFVPEENSKSSVSLLKSAVKSRVLLLKLKKPDSSIEKAEKSEEALRVRFKVDEIKGPLISLFARDYNYNISEQKATNSVYLVKEMMQKYLNILKPLYVGVEKMKNSGKVRFHGGGGRDCGGAASPPPEMARAGLRGNNLQAGFKVVRKHLGKSRSTSAAAAAVVVSPPGKMGSHRHDESVQDGIQGAILHCKRSFNNNGEGELCRSVSDPFCEKSVISSASSYSGKVVETRV